MVDSDAPQHITRLLHQAADGDEQAINALIEVAYTDLKQIAAGVRRRHFDPSQTINTTALVNEAWLRLQKHGLKAESRKHFFCVAALAMQQILVNEAHRKQAAKRQSDEALTPDSVHQDQASWMITLDEILVTLNEAQPRLAETFRLRYFLGMTETETAALLELNPRTVRRDWLTARTLISRVIA